MWIFYYNYVWLIRLWYFYLDIEEEDKLVEEGGEEKVEDVRVEEKFEIIIFSEFSVFLSVFEVDEIYLEVIMMVEVVMKLVEEY